MINFSGKISNNQNLNQYNFSSEIIKKNNHLKNKQNNYFKIQLHIRCFLNSLIECLKTDDFSKNIDNKYYVILIFYQNIFEKLFVDEFIIGHSVECICFFEFYKTKATSKTEANSFSSFLNFKKKYVYRSKIILKVKFFDSLLIAFLNDFFYVLDNLKLDHFDTCLFELTKRLNDFPDNAKKLSLNQAKKYYEKERKEFYRDQEKLSNEIYEDFENYILLLRNRLKMTFYIHCEQIKQGFFVKKRRKTIF